MSQFTRSAPMAFLLERWQFVVAHPGLVLVHGPPQEAKSYERATCPSPIQPTLLMSCSCSGWFDNEGQSRLSGCHAEGICPSPEGCSQGSFALHNPAPAYFCSRS